MKEFIHNKVKVIEDFFTEFNEVQRLYYNRSFDFDHRFTSFLTELSSYFKNRGESSKESEVLRILNMLQTVRRGFNPFSLEKISVGKREQLWGFSFNGIENINSILQEIYQKEITKLEEGEEILTNLILSLFQQGTLTESNLKELNTIPKIESTWISILAQNGSISLINKKLLVQIINEDIYMLIERIILKIVNQ